MQNGREFLDLILLQMSMKIFRLNTNPFAVVREGISRHVEWSL